MNPSRLYRSMTPDQRSAFHLGISISAFVVALLAFAVAIAGTFT